jgi:O-antigen ligase
MRIQPILASARAALPEGSLACWASIFFSASVLTLLLSIAATQSFLALATLLYFIHLLRNKPRIGFPPVKLPLALYCIWTVIAVLWATTPAAGGFEIRKLTLFLFLLLTVNLITRAKHLLFLFRVLFLEAALAGIVATAQFVRQYREVRIEQPHRVYAFMTTTRIHGFMGHWMNFGGQQMLIFAMLLAFLLLWKPAPLSSEQTAGLKNRSPRYPVWWGVMAIIVISIILNLTRGIWLGSFVTLVYLIARWKARWLWVFPVLIGISLIAGPRLMRRREASVFHPSRDRSLALRFQMWRVGWRMIRRHPIVGVGPDNIPEVYELYVPVGMIPIVGYHEHLHNDYIQLAAARGLPCLGAWLWFMVALGWAVLKMAQRFPTTRWVCHGAFAAWLGLLIEGCFEFNFGTSPVLMVFLFVISTPFAVERIEGGEAAGYQGVPGSRA